MNLILRVVVSAAMGGVVGAWWDRDQQFAAIVAALYMARLILEASSQRRAVTR